MSLWKTRPRCSETMDTVTLLERRVRRRWTSALDNNFDVRQGKAEAIQDYVNGEDMMSLSLQNSSKIALDEKIRAKWLPAHQPYQSMRSQVSKSSPKEALDCLLRRRQFNRQSFRDGEKKFAMTAVNRKTRPITRQVVLVITFTSSLTVRSPRQRQSWKVSTNRNLVYATDDKLNMKQ